jgi:hypothetical protein
MPSDLLNAILIEPTIQVSTILCASALFAHLLALRAEPPRRPAPIRAKNLRPTGRSQ